MAGTSNKWNHKLSQFPPPDESGAWNRMEMLLDRSLPLEKKKSFKYLYITALVLLLIAGICNCPNPKQQSTDNPLPEGERAISDQRPSKTEKKLPAFVKTGKKSSATEPASVSAKRQFAATEAPGAAPGIFSNLPRNNRQQSANAGGNHQYRGKAQQPGTADDASLAKTGQQLSPHKVQSSDVTNNGQLLSNDPTDSNRRPDDPTRMDTKDSLKTDSADADTLQKQPMKPSVKRLAFGAGFNYFLPVHDQRLSSLNANANPDWLSNFIPVLTARYYPGKLVYIQGELQVHAPQYTAPVLLDKKVSAAPGPAPASNRRIEKTVFVRKLFYLDVPVSLHLRVADLFVIGAGFQYSRLQKAIGLYEEKLVTPGSVDSVISSQHQTLDPDLARTTLDGDEWRYLASSSFKISKFDVGLRYTRSFSPFTRKTLIVTTPSQNRNASLSVFLRYELFGNK